MDKLRTTALAATLVWSSKVCAPAQEFGISEIPPFKPPITSLPPTFWEQHGALILWVVGGLVTIGAFTAFAVLTRKPQPAPRPEEIARKALTGLRDKQGALNGEDLSCISRITRKTLLEIARLPEEEMTTTEFCGTFEQQTLLDPEQQKQVRAFLTRCDTAKFAPGGSVSGWDPIAEALELIDLAARRGMAQTQREAAA